MRGWAAIVDAKHSWTAASNKKVSVSSHLEPATGNSRKNTNEEREHDHGESHKKTNYDQIAHYRVTILEIERRLRDLPERLEQTHLAGDSGRHLQRKSDVFLNSSCREVIDVNQVGIHDGRLLFRHQEEFCQKKSDLEIWEQHTLPGQVSPRCASGYRIGIWCMPLPGFAQCLQ